MWSMAELGLRDEWRTTASRWQSNAAFNYRFMIEARQLGNTDEEIEFQQLAAQCSHYARAYLFALVCVFPPRDY